jgi:hypothetical protein
LINRWLHDLQHPSLRAKKYAAVADTRNERMGFYFRIEGETYLLLDIMRHPK